MIPLITHLKICGITSLEDAQLCVKSGVTLLGFIFHPESPRYIAPTETHHIIQKLPLYVKSVGILVRPTYNDVLTLQKQSGCHAMQIYEPQDFKVFESFPFPVIWAFREIERLKEDMVPLLNSQDMVLIDAYSNTAYGGTGHVFDWDKIPKSFSREKLILAGGITPLNIKNALEKVHPAIIDVAGGSEKKPREKDITKIQQLNTLVMQYNVKRLSGKPINFQKAHREKHNDS
ncbi:MAG: phosphoribosylanthranilate isomerase [Candidatus Marinimicrobia bacterium]|nr:phosphoribosylanthranilate isomerase [Candidatus Neomarinimicrobiota bacterium]